MPHMRAVPSNDDVATVPLSDTVTFEMPVEGRGGGR
jgi:hypothetical protein